MPNVARRSGLAALESSLAVIFDRQKFIPAAASVLKFSAARKPRAILSLLLLIFSQSITIQQA
jgi:hypothetical protein